MSALTTKPQRFFLWPGTGWARVLSNLLTLVQHLDDARAWKVTVERVSKERSARQNAYLWGVAYDVLEEETGQEAEDWHEFFLCLHFGERTTSLFGKTITKPVRTTTTNEHGERDVLSTLDFMAYVETIQRVAAQHSVFIPDPDPELARR